MKREERKLKRAYRPTPEENERRNRIRVAVAAYAYEIKDDPIMSDHEYDQLALKVNLRQPTGNKKMDRWFRENFDPSTGMWVRNHPRRKGLNRIYKQWRK